MIVPYLTAAGNAGRFTTDARILLGGIAVKLDSAEVDVNRVAQRWLGDLAGEQTQPADCDMARSEGLEPQPSDP